MGNRSAVIRDGRDQSLLNNNAEPQQQQPQQQQQQDQDAHLQIGQPTMKNTMAIKNPFILKKESLSIERDSTQRNMYYIKFTYDSLIDFKVNLIYRPKLVKNDKETLYKTTLENNHNDINNNNISNSYSTSLSIKCFKGFDVVFNEVNFKIDTNVFADKEKLPEADYDIVIELLPIDFQTTEPLGFYTLCNLVEDKITDTMRIYKLKVESQRLRAQGMVLEINELFLAHREQGECLICYEKLANTVLLPCRHSCCSGCAHGLRLRNLPCPMCKNSKDTIF